MARDLSTFTAHLTAVRDIAAGAGPGSLVLVDEIAADTDPREGAALASAILEEFLDRGATVLVTTHLDELKALALSDPRFANARVGFDPERLAPTFQLHLGSPGSSSAIEVARRVGLPEPVLERARAALSGRGGALGEALRTLVGGAGAPRGAAGGAGARGRGGPPQGGGGGPARGGRVPRREGGRGPGRGVAGRGGRGRARRGPAGAGRAPVCTHREEGHRGVPAARGVVGLPGAGRRAWPVSQAAAAPEAAPGGAVEPGVRVRVASLGQEGEVLEVSGDEAVVQLGGLRVRRPVTDLLPLRGKAKGATLARARDDRLRAAEHARPAPLESVSRRLDVRGMRVDDLLREVDAFLDRLFAEGAVDAVILHGHGTGALKEALRDHLKESPYVGAFRRGDPQEGGDAVTVCAFRR